MTRRPFVSIIGPFYNEEDYIRDTLSSLAAQVDHSGNLFDRESFEIILVDNRSTDGTLEVIKTFSAENPGLKFKVLKEMEKGHIHARISGMRFAIHHQNGPHVLVGIDTDTLFPKRWLQSLLDCLEQEDASACGSPGYFTGEMWLTARRLSERYLREVGTLFFDPETVEKLGAKGKRYLFTQEVFKDFERPFSDCGFAIKKEAYLRAGGYRIEHQKANPSQELLAEGWRLKFQLDHLGEKVSYTDKTFFTTSPRRFLQDSVGMFDGTTYDTMADYRSRVRQSDFMKLDSIAGRLNFRHLQAYVVRNYMLLPCLTKAPLLQKNRRYFAGFYDELEADLKRLRDSLDWKDSNSIFETGYTVTEKYFDKVLNVVSQLEFRA
ncbi:MAG: glycosyltransferase family 2 protein [Elusimicrobia bacterium]|nr:glycosyltransferase family 2 protein [Elusimicrobiota bacterium]